MKTIATCSQPQEATLIQLRLEAVGITAYLRDETVIQLQPFYSNLLGGVKVEVADSDYEAAIEFLKADSGDETGLS